ncbi:MAG: hypothetical protein AAF385_12020, partial [Pseudomonadota bacterium]
MKLRTHAIALLMGLALAGCNSSNNSGQAPLVTITGTFGTVPVAGLSYDSASTSGKTDANGTFTYVAGETLSFSIGNLELGEVEGAATLTEFDLGPGTSLPEDEYALRRMISGVAERGGFYRVMNIMSLLQTLDSDQDLANGIELNANMEASFGRYLVDLDQPMYSFRRSKYLRFELYSANAAGALSPRPVVSAGRALDAIGGPMIEVSGTMLHEFNEATGTDYREDLSFDAAGMLSSRSVDTSNDGSYDQIVGRDYDQAGNVVTFRNDFDADGVDNRIENYTYDEFGSEIGEERYNSDGDLTRQYRQVWSSTGQLLEREAIIRTRNLLEVWRFDGNSAVYEKDVDTDGTIDEIRQLTFSDARELLEELIDLDADGIVDEKVTREYSPLRLMTLEQRDLGNDGTIDFESSCSYNEKGLRLECVNHSERSHSREIYTYSDSDHYDRYEYDLDNDGIVNYSTDLFRLSDGRLDRVERDIDADGSINYIATLTYNENGLLIREERDTNADGVTNYVVDTSYEGARKV